jgi:hypothetical protein
MTLRWVLLSAVWNELDMSNPTIRGANAQSKSGFNLASEGYSDARI